MLKNYRNLFAAGVLALGLAACGDDVTVTPPPPPPPPPTPGVTSVTVSPNAQTINVGQTVVFAAAVVADVGITNTGVDWSSSNTAIATADPVTGAVKGVAPGSTTIIAKSKQDPTRLGVSTVTVVALPAGVTSFNATPPNFTLSVGQTQTATITAVYAAGVTAPAITYSTLNSSVATVNTTTGVITAVAPGNAIIRASATLPADPSRGTSAQTVTADISVTVLAAPSISIKSITQGAILVPVDISNVMGQIEVTVTINSRDQPLDSVVVYLDENGVPKSASRQNYNGTAPFPTDLTLNIQTDNYTKNVAAGTTTVFWHNGPTAVRAAIWRTNPNGGPSVGGISVTDCSVNPGAPICAAPITMVLNNPDSWVADMTKPTTAANIATSPAGLTFWGGPGSNGFVTAQLYSVIYTPGREIQTVNWTIGTASTGNTCGISTDFVTGAAAVIRPWKRTFGYATTALPTPAPNVFCAREWNNGGLGDRDNVIVINALDNASNNFVGTLLPNAVLLGSTPDSGRFDWLAPAVTTPSLAQAAPLETGWVNGSYNFINFGSTDGGVGLRAVRDRKTFYNVVNCPVAGAQNVAMPTGTGADIPECGILVNSLGGTAAMNAFPAPGTAPYTIYGTESDRLNNAGNSSTSLSFGVDKVVPQIRQGLASLAPALPAVPGADTVFRASKPVAGTHEFRPEYLDDRSGFYAPNSPGSCSITPGGLGGTPDCFGVSAIRTAMNKAGHVNPVGACVAPATGPIGAAFLTAPTCNLPYMAAVGPFRSDGWQAGERVNIPAADMYYGYTAQATDRAGNVSVNSYRKLLVNAVSPFPTGLGIPGTLTPTNFAIVATLGDSAEVTQQSLQMEYPNLPILDSVRWSRNPVGLAFNDVITSPLQSTDDPKGCIGTACSSLSIYARRIETVTATVWDGVTLPVPTNVNPTGFVFPASVKPTTARAWAWNHGSTLFTAPVPGTAAPAPASSLLVPISGLFVQDGMAIADFNTAFPNQAVKHWRIIPTLSTTDQYGSTVPLRAQAISPTQTPNAPFVRVDFFRLQAGVTGSSPMVAFTGVAGQVASHWSYLGSAFGNVNACPTGSSGTSGGVCASDQGAERSWVYALGIAQWATDWTGAAQTVVTGSGSSQVTNGVRVGERVIAVGITATGDAIVTAVYFP